MSGVHVQPILNYFFYIFFKILILIWAIHVVKFMSKIKTESYRVNNWEIGGRGGGG